MVATPARGCSKKATARRKVISSSPTSFPSNQTFLTRFFVSPLQVGKQIVAALFIIGWNIVMTSLIMNFIKLIGIPLRMGDEVLEVGDEAVHGEDAYALWGEGDTFDESVHGWYGYDKTTHGQKKLGPSADAPEGMPTKPKALETEVV
jgi:hypothetical protein